MKTLRFLIIAMALSLPCFAWNCSTSGQVRVQVPTGTLGNGTGDGSGQVVVDNGLTFICEALPTNTVATPVNNNSSSSSSATGGNSTSGAIATGGQGGNSSSSATGGAGGQGGAGGSVSNSGNSTNTNSLNQKQKQQQSQGQTQTATGGNATATGNGDGSNDTTTNVEASKIPVNTASAPTGLPTVTCFKPTTMGAQTAPFGFAFGGGKIDENCARLEVARSFDVAGERLAACKVKISNKYSKQAGVTLEDCLQQQKQAVVIPATVAPAPAPQIVVVPLPAPVALPTNAAVEAFQGFYTRIDNVTKARLDGTIILLRNHPDSHIRLRYNHASESVVFGIVGYLDSNGIDLARIEGRDDGYEKGVEVLFIQ